MDNRITSDTDIEFYRDNFNFKVFAGPGAGKTYFLIKNIISTIKNSSKLKDSNRKILCITYTNVAADEIKQRLGDYKKYVEVSTIHAFLYEFVIKPYQQQLKYILKKVYGCNVPKSKGLFPRREGFGLLTNLKRSDFVNTLIEKYKIEIAADVSKRKLGDYILDLKEINTYPFNKEKTKLSVVNKLGLTDEDALKLKRAIWENEGVLDFDEILYFSYVLLKEFKFVKYDVQFHFPYILVDEYQDTNPIQNAMIEMIAENKNVSVGVVGDMAQSIYGFQGATYLEFKNFTLKSKEFKEYVINGNRRSNINIVNFLNYVRKSDDKLSLQECIKNTENKSKITFVVSKREDIDVVNSIDKNAIILCRRWVDAFRYLSGISQEQNRHLIQLHNFYRYQVDRDLIKDFENDSINWISQVRLIVRLKDAVRNKDFNGILIEMGKLFKLDLFDKDVNQHNTKEYRELQKFINIFDNFDDNDTYESIIRRLQTELDLDNVQLEKIYDLELPGPGEDNYTYPFHSNLYKLNLKTLRVMVNEIFTENSRYVTIHRTKGKEYESVFVNLEPLHEERDLVSIVNVLCDPKIIDDQQYAQSEFVRIAYVAFSRAINNLYIYIDADDNKVEEMFKALDAYISTMHLDKFYQIKHIQ